MTNFNEIPSPAEALETVRRSREATAERLVHHAGWYNLCYAVVVGGMVVCQGFDAPINIIGTSLCTVVLVVMMQVLANRTGLRLTGLTPPRARWVAVGLGVVMAFVLFAAAAANRLGLGWPVVGLLAVVGALIAWFASRLWLKVYLRESGGRS